MHFLLRFFALQIWEIFLTIAIFRVWQSLNFHISQPREILRARNLHQISQVHQRDVVNLLFNKAFHRLHYGLERTFVSFGTILKKSTTT